MIFDDYRNTNCIGSRIVFATVTNFMMLLLVQAPTKDYAVRAKSLVDLWRETLQNLSKSSPMMNLGLVRLNGPLWAGLSTNYNLPRHSKRFWMNSCFYMLV